MESHLRDLLMLITLRHVKLSERTEEKSKKADIAGLRNAGKRPTRTWKGSASRERVDESSTERASIAEAAEHAQAEHDTLANFICKLELTLATCNGELGVFARLFSH